jgi:hypothetical protein
MQENNAQDSKEDNINSQSYNPQTNDPLNNQQDQNIYNQTNFNPNYPEQNPTFIQRINTTASGVIDYIKSKTPTMPNINLPKNPLIKIDYSLNLQEINTENYENEINNNTKETKCDIILKSKLNNINIIAKIEKPKIINDSYFKPSYVIYDIITEEFNWIVQRRYSDFIWLRDTLNAIFPMEVLPYLPKKKMTNKRFEKNFIEKRQKGLQKFLNDILKNAKFKSTEILSSFLSCAERNLFEQEKKNFNINSLIPKNVTQMKTLDGKIKLVDFEKLENTNNYFTNINNYIKYQNEIIQNIQSNLYKFNSNIISACINLEEVEKSFNNIYSFSQKVKLNDNISNVYLQYETFFKNWKRILMNEVIVIKDIVKSFFREIKGKSDNYSQLLDKQEYMKSDYINRNNKLNLKKETLYQKLDVKNFELNPFENIDNNLLYKDKKYAFEKMCYKETEELKNIKDLIQSYYYQNYINFKELINEFEKSYVNNLREFSNSFQPSVTDGVEIWSYLSSNIPLE